MINGLKLFGLYLNMLGNVFSRPENKKIYIRRIVDEMIKLGVNSLTIVSIISLFMGAVVTIQTGLQLNNPFIPKYLIGYATRESLILEFSPTMIALILAGKVGSSIASEIGTMRVSELKVSSNDLKNLFSKEQNKLLQDRFDESKEIEKAQITRFMQSEWEGFRKSKDADFVSSPR